MKIVDIKNSSMRLVKEFLDNAGKSLERFKYYNKRDYQSASRNHLVTLIGLDEESKPVAYGHLDQENGVVWLGICVAEKSAGHNYGTEMMQALVSHADEHNVPEVTLGVDITNTKALQLFVGFGFNYESKGIAGRPELARMTRRNPAMDTVGSLVDKLATCNQKLFISQEVLYEIRRMKNFEEFQAKYLNSEDTQRRLWEMLQKTCDLNLQRSALVTEVDQKIVDMIQTAIAGKDLDNGAFIQRPAKTY